MIAPSEKLNDFELALIKHGIEKKFHYYYRKWLWYYLSFCQKYHNPGSRKESLSLFIAKLKEKHQTETQQKQAAHAVSLYQGLMRGKQQITEKSKIGQSCRRME